MQELLVGLALWLGANSPYTISPAQLPAVEYRAQIELRRMVFCEDFKECDNQKLPDIGIAATYEHKRLTMYLPREFDIRDQQQVATLVHELVHHGQKLAGKFESASCVGSLEAEAYRIEDRWLVANGLPPTVQTLAIIMAQTCIPGPT